MKMVVTLKNGVQIKADVEDFSTGVGSLNGDLRNLNLLRQRRAEAETSSHCKAGPWLWKWSYSPPSSARAAAPAMISIM